jgi:putative nucleotidyltransferase with HDIG domain
MLIPKIEKFVIPLYKKYKKDPKLWENHVQLTRKFALELAEIEKADKQVLEIAVLFHDVGKYKDKENHNIVSYEIAKKFLENIDLPKKDLILKCILKHRSEFSSEDSEIEVRVIQSADALGTLFDEEWQEHCRKTKSMEELLEKYDKTFNKINLESARKIAKPQVEKLKKLLEVLCPRCKNPLKYCVCKE